MNTFPPYQSDWFSIFLTKCNSLTFEWFREYPEFVSVLTDKSKRAAIVRRADYQGVILGHLNSSFYLRLLSVDSAVRYISNRHDVIMIELVTCGVVLNSKANQAKIQESLIPNLYGLLKDNKQDIQFRQVINTRNSVGYYMSSVVLEILTKCTYKFKFEVSGAKHTLDRLSCVLFDPQHGFATLDVESMFTNINSNMVREVRNLLLKSKTFKDRLAVHSKVPFDLFLKAVMFCAFQSSVFNFYGLHYKQRVGLRMGSSLSPALANLVVENYLDRVGLVCKPAFLVKYVDDILILDSPKGIASFIERFHKVSKIKLIRTDESNSSIPFLNVLFIRDSGLGFTNCWYRKEFSSDRILHAKSFHPRSVIRNTYVEFINTALDLTTSCYRDDLEVRVSRILGSNGLPEAYLVGIWNEVRRSRLSKKRGNTCDELEDCPSKKRQYASIPYLGETSGRFLNMTLTLTSLRDLQIKDRLFSTHLNIRLNFNC